jgi:hypothetical protein
VRRADAVEPLLIAFAVTVLVAALAWPVPIAPNTWVIGTSNNDHNGIAYTFAVVADALAHGRAPWGDNAWIEFPTGVWLFPADIVDAVALAPVTLAFGPWVAFNLAAIVHHGLAAGFGYGWLRAERADRTGALFGALALALHPALVTATFDGNPDVTPFFWIPAALWAGRGASPGRVALATGCAALGGLANPYVGVMGVAALFFRWAVERRWRDVGAAALALAVVAAADVAVTSQMFGLKNAAVRKGPRMDLIGVAPLSTFLRPWPTVLRTDPFWGAPSVGTTGYLSWVTLAAAGLGWWGSRERWPLALIALGVIAALGPELLLDDARTGPPGAPTPPSTGVPLPWMIADWLPGLNRMHLTARFTGWCFIAFVWLASRRPLHWVWIPALLLDLLVLTGGVRALGSERRFDDGTCEVVSALPPGPVLDLPGTYHELWVAASLCHGHPVAEGINRPFTQKALRALEAGPSRAPAALRKLGYRWVVFHHPPGVTFGPSDFGDLRERLGEPYRSTASLTVFDLGPAPQR